MERMTNFEDLVEEEDITRRRKYMTSWYTIEELKLFRKYINNNDTESLKTMCKCYNKNNICPACFLINARKRYTQKFPNKWRKDLQNDIK